MANTNTLSWQSAFWAIVPIALNTMTFPSGKTLGYPSSYSFALKVSPVICAVSVLEGVGQLILSVKRERSFAPALRRWTTARIEETAEYEEGSFESLRRNKYFAWCLFLLGAFPQMLKIFATRGVPWTQACCVAYIASFTLDAYVTLLAPREESEKSPWEAANDDEQEQQRLSRQGSVRRAIPETSRVTRDTPSTPAGNKSGKTRLNTVYVLRSIISVRVILCRGTSVLADLIASYGTKVSVPVYISYNLLMLVLFAPLVGLKFVKLGLRESNTVFIFWGILSTCWTTFFAGLYISMPEPLQLLGSMPLLDVLFAFLLCLAAIIGAVICVECLHRTDDQRVSKRVSKQIRFRLGLYHTLEHVIAAVLFYSLRYDPKSTYRPSWTNYLG